MISALGPRLDKLEAKLPEPKRSGRVIRIVAGDQDKEAAHRLLEAEGYDPDNGDLAILRLIAVPAGQAPWSKPPYVAGKADQ